MENRLVYIRLEDAAKSKVIEVIRKNDSGAQVFENVSGYLVIRTNCPTKFFRKLSGIRSIVS